MSDFHQTRMGQRFYESTMPSIAESLAKIAEKLEPKIVRSDVDELRKLLAWLESVAYREWTVESVIDVVAARLRPLVK